MFLQKEFFNTKRAQYSKLLEKIFQNETWMSYLQLKLTQIAGCTYYKHGLKLDQPVPLSLLVVVTITTVS